MIPGIGIHPYIPEGEYRSYKAVNQSLLKLCEKSVGHFKYWFDRIGLPPSEGEEKDDALFLGTAIHCAILEPDKFKATYLNSGCYSKAKKDFKDFKAANPNHIVLSSKEYGICEGILNSITNTNTARKLLEKDSYNEIVTVWEDTTGILCKSRSDRYITLNGRPAVIDVKSTIDASPEGFPKSVINWGYHIQAAFYLDGFKAVTGERHDQFTIIAVEKEPPYAVMQHDFGEEDIRDGRTRYRRWLTMVHRAMENDRWPLYPDTIQRIFLPKWYRQQTSTTN